MTEKSENLLLGVAIAIVLSFVVYLLAMISIIMYEEVFGGDSCSTSQTCSACLPTD